MNADLFHKGQLLQVLLLHGRQGQALPPRPQDLSHEGSTEHSDRTLAVSRHASDTADVDGHSPALDAKVFQDCPEALRVPLAKERLWRHPPTEWGLPDLEIELVREMAGFF